MRIIDRYIIRQVLVPFLLGLLVFTFIFIIPALRDHAETLVSKGVPVTIVLQLMALLIPQALALTIPMSLLLALLVAFGRLSADREFVAMQACGVSLLRLLRPVSLIAISCWAATAYVLMVAVPTANQTFRQMVFDIGAQRAEGEVKPRVFFDQFPDLVVYVRDVPATGGWKGVFMADLRGGQGSAIYLARQGHVVIDRDKRLIDMVLEHGSRHSADPAGKYEVILFDRMVLSVDPATLFGSVVQKGDNEMTIPELRARILEQEKARDSTHNQWMAIHRKFSIPVACLVFGLIGLALGATHRRDGMLGSFVIGLVVIFLYYVPQSLGPQLAKGGLVQPWLAVWMPNILLGILGVMMFIWRDRVADQPIRLPVPAFVQRRRRSVAVGPTRVPFVSILDRYVSVTYGRFLFLSAAAMAAVFYIATFIDLSDKLFKGTATWTMLGQYFWYATPQYIYYILPLSVLLAALVTIAILTKNSELIVMKACGISLYRVALPMFVTALLAGGALFLLDETVLGPANRRAETLNHVIRGGKPETFDVLNRRWVVGTENEIYHYDWFNPRLQQLSGLLVYELSADMQRLTRRTVAEQATYVGEREGDGAEMWKVERGWTRVFDEKGAPRTDGFTPFTTAMEVLETVDYFGVEQPNAEFMGYTQLRGEIERLAVSGFDVLELQVGLARKISFPFVTLVMTLIAVPFAVTIGRSGAMGGIGVGLVLAITYWIAFSAFAALGTGGMITPTLAAWAPNLLFGAGAAYLLLTVKT